MIIAATHPTAAGIGISKDVVQVKGHDALRLSRSGSLSDLSDPGEFETYGADESDDEEQEFSGEMPTPRVASEEAVGDAAGGGDSCSSGKGVCESVAPERTSDSKAASGLSTDTASQLTNPFYSEVPILATQLPVGRAMNQGLVPFTAPRSIEGSIKEITNSLASAARPGNAETNLLASGEKSGDLAPRLSKDIIAPVPLAKRVHTPLLASSAAVMSEVENVAPEAAVTAVPAPALASALVSVAPPSVQAPASVLTAAGTTLAPAPAPDALAQAQASAAPDRPKAPAPAPGPASIPEADSPDSSVEEAGAADIPAPFPAGLNLPQTDQAPAPALSARTQPTQTLEEASTEDTTAGKALKPELATKTAGAMTQLTSTGTTSPLSKPLPSPISADQISVKLSPSKSRGQVDPYSQGPAGETPAFKRASLMLGTAASKAMVGCSSAKGQLAPGPVNGTTSRPTTASALKPVASIASASASKHHSSTTPTGGSTKVQPPTTTPSRGPAPADAAAGSTPSRRQPAYASSNTAPTARGAKAATLASSGSTTRASAPPQRPAAAHVSSPASKASLISDSRASLAISTSKTTGASAAAAGSTALHRSTSAGPRIQDLSPGKGTLTRASGPNAPSSRALQAGPPSLSTIRSQSARLFSPGTVKTLSAVRSDQSTFGSTTSASMTGTAQRAPCASGRTSKSSGPATHTPTSRSSLSTAPKVAATSSSSAALGIAGRPPGRMQMTPTGKAPGTAASRATAAATSTPAARALARDQGSAARALEGVEGGATAATAVTAATTATRAETMILKPCPIGDDKPALTPSTTPPAPPSSAPFGAPSPDQQAVVSPSTPTQAHMPTSMHAEASPKSSPQATLTLQAPVQDGAATSSKDASTPKQGATPGGTSGGLPFGAWRLVRLKKPKACDACKGTVEVETVHGGHEVFQCDVTLQPGTLASVIAHGYVPPSGPPEPRTWLFCPDPLCMGSAPTGSGLPAWPKKMILEGSAKITRSEYNALLSVGLDIKAVARSSPKTPGL